jgi:sulfite exporter TauE/SafE
MCGGILTTLMLGTPAAEQKAKAKTFRRSLVYNLGRITSYTLAGLLAGFFGAQFLGLSQNLNLHFILQCIAALVLIGLALSILGYSPINKFTESLGMKLWKKLQPLSKGLYPINTLRRAFLFGMLWGWLPCGLVYSALLLSLSSGTLTDGMLIMLFFGLGTLPGMLTTGYLADYLNQLKTNKPLKVLTASLMILFAISLPVSTFYFSGQHTHAITHDGDHQQHHTVAD